MSTALQQALQHYKAGNFEGVAAGLQQAVKSMKTVDLPVALLLAQSCYKLGRLPEAARWYDTASQTPGANSAQLGLLAANLYLRSKGYDKALAVTRRLLQADAGNLDALAVHRNCLRTLMLFDEMRASDRALLAQMQVGGSPALFAMEKPLDHIFWCADEAVNAQLTRIDDIAPFTPQSRAARRSRPHQWGEKIRVGYLSGDVSDQHATMRLIQGVFLAHDREKFEISIFCHTDAGVIATDQGLRQRYNTVVPIGHLSDAEAEALIRARNIDILVDLKGHTRDSRLSIFNYGAAPLQVAYLGFPGICTGIDCDYMIGDAVVTPDSSKPLHPLKICRLPESYQANDDTHRALPAATPRAELGLPEDKIVFASFNATLKLSPLTFDLWVRILTAVPDSVLWIMCEIPAAAANFSAAMSAAGIGAERIIFAGRSAYPPHVARLQAADIALDTFPCNGHTTTSDKLWAGLPVVTFKGSNFASRVSESLLRALGLPELVTEDADGFVALCIALATDTTKRRAIREKIAANRFAAPLFDTERLTRHLEIAYETMVERARQGLPPEHFDVPTLPRRTAPFGPKTTA